MRNLKILLRNTQGETFFRFFIFLLKRNNVLHIEYLWLLQTKKWLQVHRDLTLGMCQFGTLYTGDRRDCDTDVKRLKRTWHLQGSCAKKRYYVLSVKSSSSCWDTALRQTKTFYALKGAESLKKAVFFLMTQLCIPSQTLGFSIYLPLEHLEGPPPPQSPLPRNTPPPRLSSDTHTHKCTDRRPWDRDPNPRLTTATLLHCISQA